MVLPIWLCGAVPFHPALDCYGSADDGPAALRCCHCHVMESLQLLSSFEQSLPVTDHVDDDNEDSLPDAVFRRDKFSQTEETDSPRDKQFGRLQVPADDEDEDKSAAQWRQVGQDLRRIADQFESLRRPSGRHPQSSQTTSWIQSYVLPGVVAYVGWRIQRWVFG